MECRTYAQNKCEWKSKSIHSNYEDPLKLLDGRRASTSSQMAFPWRAKWEARSLEEENVGRPIVFGVNDAT